MPKLRFEDFITCFRKQFIFQTGRGGNRICKYYTAHNQEQGLKNDKWAIMVFIHTGNHFGFSDDELQDELHIRFGLYEVLKQEVRDVLSRNYHDKKLREKVKVKIGLVKNCVRCYYGV